MTVESGTERTTDVIVVGGGGSGLAAAVSAAQRGVSVLVVEKQSRLGGSTSLSVGSITAAGTRQQRRAGIRDCADDFEEDMIAFDPNLLKGDAPALRRVLATEAATTVEWLESLGVAFVGPYPEPPHRVARMHNVIPNSRAYIARLSEAAKRLGVQLLLGAEVIDLITDRGSVIGVQVRESDGRQATLRARRGVILASGDFSGNAEMRQQHLPAAAAAAHPVNPNASGDGHRLAARLGAQPQRMDMTFGPQLRFPPPPRTGLLDRLPMWSPLCKLEAFLVQRLPASALRPFVKSLLITHMSPSSKLFERGAILVNRDGVRFCDERESVSALSAQEGAEGYIVFGSEIAKVFSSAPNSISTAPGIAFAYFEDYRRGRPDLVKSADSTHALAKLIHLDGAVLADSMRDRGFTAPYFAMGPVYSMLTVTEGGLAVDDQTRVLDRTGAPIENLYAVGGVGQGGMLLMGHGHHIGWAMTSGRLAGQSVASRLVSKQIVN